MAQSGFKTSYDLPKGGIIKSLVESAATIVAAIERRHQIAGRRRALKGLTVDELEDIGYPAADAVEPKPILEIKAGLMTTLMSMR
ncbi:hypothetical protein [Mesorhizobium onobrychidis]|uniref:DUF1127 domain-containing protein n=1 Tax=Mesorhizobium onobrychidis TaxID=2775404 RepID=A0ABY5QW51_9HYPH|nr:hypothetical protein [Mesorhizobium onobrychidis]UVC14292.1 hypothetical protein IHQ72_27110 [Mesorhizobium onobrychidis]